jgi:hypothetical protein
MRAVGQLVPTKAVALATLILGSVGDVTSGAAPVIYTKDNAPPIPAREQIPLRESVSQYGITWRFDKAYPVGRFVNGDWWVLGPVRIVSVEPVPGPAAAGDSVEIEANQFGDTALQNDTRMRNGSMVVLRGGNRGQGYDSRVRNYEPDLTIEFPYTLEVNHSLVSTDSHPPAALPAKPFFKGSRDRSWAVLRTAAVLTCLAEAPPADAFRPCYAGTDKAEYRASDLRRELLLKLKPVDSTPSYEQFARYFQRLWLDDQTTWLASRSYPSENCPDYGREHARLVSMGSLLLLLDAPVEQKEPLLIGLVQLGIDLHGLSRIGGRWPAEGGIWSGRKWPIIFAGIMLGREEMQRIPDEVIFCEDQQTYYGRSFFGQTALWQMGIHHRPAPPYEEKDPATWDDMDRRSEGYRICCTANAWIGQCLAAMLLKGRAAWNHDAFFNYCDRWMSKEDAEIAAKRPGSNWCQGKAWDEFATNMWHAYRDQVPDQPGGRRNRKWVWDDGGKWVGNPKPVSAE